MSRSVDLFIDAPASLEEVAAATARAAGAEVRPVASRPDGTDGAGRPSVAVEAAGVRATLRAHAYLDDGALALSRYRYVLSVVLPDDLRPQDSPGIALLRAVARGLGDTTGWPVLLVMDLQYSDALVRDGLVDREGAAATPAPPDEAADAPVPPGGTGDASAPPEGGRSGSGR